MASPTRFPKGLNTFPPRHTLNTFPIATSPRGIVLAEDFQDYIAANWTLTTAVGGTATYFPAITGGLKLATTASGTDTVYVSRAGCQFQLMAQNQAWFNYRVAYPRSVLNANDTNIVAGWMNAVTASATEGIYFLKPTGGTTVHLVIEKGNTQTTFRSVADLAVPSGLFGDTNSVNGTLNATIAGTAFTATSVATAGAGYMVSPLVLSTSTAAGTVGQVPVNVALGSTSYGGNPLQALGSTDIPYGSLYAPYLTTPGSGYSNNAGATTLLEVEPVLDLSFFYDGTGTAYFGVNGRTVLSIGPDGRTAVAAGDNPNLATLGTNSFAPTNTLTSSVSPVALQAGSFMNIAPLGLLTPFCGFANTTANIRTFYLINNYNGIERN